MIENTFAPERVRERGGGERRDIVVRVPEHDCNQFKWNISIWETINEGILLYVPWLPWLLCSLIILALWSHINLVQLFIEYNAVENARPWRESGEQIRFRIHKFCALGFGSRSVHLSCHPLAWKRITGCPDIWVIFFFLSVERLVAALISFVNLPCTYTSGSLCSVNVFGERIVVRTGNRVLCARARVCISVVSITLHFSIAIRWKYPNRTRSENRLSSKSTHTHRTLIGAR